MIQAESDKRLSRRQQMTTPPVKLWVEFEPLSSWLAFVSNNNSRVGWVLDGVILEPQP